MNYSRLRLLKVKGNVIFCCGEYVTLRWNCGKYLKNKNIFYRKTFYNVEIYMSHFFPGGDRL